MNLRIIQRHMAAMALCILPAAGQAQSVIDVPLGEATERHLSADMPVQRWAVDAGAIAEEGGDQLAMREVIETRAETVKLVGVVPPIYFDSGIAEIPESTVAELARLLDEMRHAQVRATLAS